VSSLFPVAPEKFSFDYKKKLYSLERKGEQVAIREL